MPKGIPDSDYCYEKSTFSEGKKCPDLEDTFPRDPKCKKYEEVLTWTRSGVILKCNQCKKVKDA